MGSGTIKPDSCSTFKALDAEFATAQLLLAFVTDPRTTPIYPIAEAARIVQAPRSTLCGWVPQHSVLGLTFLELLEAYTIQTLRTRHQLPMRAIKRALKFLRKETGEPHPLALEGLGYETDGSELFITHLGKLVSASDQGQIAMRQVLDAFLQRVEYRKRRPRQPLLPVYPGFSHRQSAAHRRRSAVEFRPPLHRQSRRRHRDDRATLQSRGDGRRAGR